MPTLLYYPLVRPPQAVLHQALLYWDDIASVVPGDPEVYEVAVSEELKDLKARGALPPHRSGPAIQPATRRHASPRCFDQGASRTGLQAAKPSGLGHGRLPLPLKGRIPFGGGDHPPRLGAAAWERTDTTWCSCSCLQGGATPLDRYVGTGSGSHDRCSRLHALHGSTIFL